MNCFTSLGGRRMFVTFMAVDPVVGTRHSKSRDHILFFRVPFSNL